MYGLQSNLGKDDKEVTSFSDLMSPVGHKTVGLGKGSANETSLDKQMEAILQVGGLSGSSKLS